MRYDLKKPVLLLTYNRPNHVKRVLTQIKKYKPSKLYVFADGPKSKDDIKLCEQNKKKFTSTSFDFETEFNFLDENSGLKYGVSSAINWFFANEREGIILEDDCLPHKSFFNYCEELLEYHKSNKKVMHIGGANHFDGPSDDEASYHFSHYSAVWGWATWRDRWKKFNVNMPDLDEQIEQDFLSEITDNKKEKAFYYRVFKRVKEEELDSWGYIWMYTIFKYQGLCTYPSKNLISNIGFDEEATHTTDENAIEANKPTYSIGEIKHRDKIIVTKDADRKRSQIMFPDKRNKSFIKRVKSRLLWEFKKILGIVKQ